jgi:protease PrsW
MRRRDSRLFGRIIRVFLLGCACTLPAILVEQMSGATLRQDTITKSVLVSFFLIAPIEEFFKLIAVWGAYRGRDFDEPMHAMIYAATAALGFVSVENIRFMAILGPESFLSRILYATPAHIMFSCMWGYSMGVARFQHKRELLTIAKGFFVAIFLHGFYNFVVAVQPSTAKITLVPLLAFMAWLLYARYRELRRNPPIQSLGEGAFVLCPNCGAYTPEILPNCSRCGFEIWTFDDDRIRICGRCRTQMDENVQVCPRCGNAASGEDHIETWESVISP